MKKIHVTIFTSFLILAFFSCKQQESMKEYINRGFSKPTIENGDIVEFKSLGNGGKVYVPSEKEIEVQFAIKNKYNVDIKGELEFPEDKKTLFNKVPEIKELTPTKMVVAFNFKAEAEPKNANQFLGESVGMTLKIFDKKVGRFLSSQILTANCNTPPEKIGTITYNEADDKYSVVLPINGGLHNDLEKVEFTLSSEGNDEKKTFSIDIGNGSQQGQTIDLPIKGNGERQLKNPSGKRKIEVTVYDKAGLKSEENKKEGVRIFTSIELLPSEKTVSVEKAKNGVPIPEIKQLKEFFDGDDWKKVGYTVEYSASNPAGFVYDAEKKVFKNANPQITPQTEPGYKIQVTLNRPGGNSPLSETFTIKVVGNTNVDVDTDNLKITDITDYSPRRPLLLFNDPIAFLDDGNGVLIANVQVPYTSFDTKLKVEVQAVVEETQGKDEGAGGANWSNPSYKKEYEITIGNLSSNSMKEIKFSITSKANSSIKKTYKIIFQRQTPLKVTMIFEKNMLPNGKTAKVVASWAYKSEEFSFTVKNDNTNENEKEIIVGQNQEITFNITVGEGVRVERCTSHLPGNTTPTDTYTVPGAGGKIKITASTSFELVIKIRPDALLVDWHNCKRLILQETTCGYDKGMITYTKPNESATTIDELSQSDTKRFVKDGTPVTLKIEGLHTTHHVEKWFVNGAEVTEGQDFSLSADKCELTILKAKTDYPVEVELAKNPVTLTAKFTGEKTGHPHGYTFKVRDITGNSNLLNTSTTDGEFTCGGIQASNKVKIEATLPAGRRAKYGIKEWQKLKDDGSTWETIQDSQNKTSIELIMNKNEEVKAVLAPQYTVTLSPRLDANAGQLTIANKDAAILSAEDILAEVFITDSSKSKTITHDGSLYFKVTGTGTDNLVVSYKRKALDGTEAEMTSLFDPTTCMWKEKGSFNLDPGDEFIVEIAKVQRILLSVRENNNAHYTDNYTFKIFATNSDSDKMLFPKFPGGEIYTDSSKMAIKPDRQYPIYITKETKLTIILDNLHGAKEIAEWKNGGTILGTDFNDEHDKPASRIGKGTVVYTHNGTDYNDFDLKAIIRDKTYLLTVEIRDYYRDDKPFEKLKANGDVDIKIKKSGDGAVLATLNKDKNEYKRRFKAGEKIELDAKTRGDKYRFALWKTDDISLTDRQKYSNDLAGNLLTLPNNDVKITGFYTKHLIVVMHKRNDGGESTDLPDSVFSGTGDTKYGKTKVIAYNYNDQKIAECIVNNNQDDIQQFKHTANNPFDDEFFLIKGMPSSNEEQAKYIVLHFEKPENNSNLDDKKIFWKYSQVDYLGYDYIPWTYYSNENAYPIYIEDGRTKVKFMKIEFLNDFSILHLWLHKV